MLLPSLSPLTWVNNAVNEAGGSGFGCCRQHAAGVVGNACLEVPVNMLGTAAFRALRPSLSRTEGSIGKALLGTALAPQCDLFLEVTCSMGCQ